MPVRAEEYAPYHTMPAFRRGVEDYAKNRYVNPHGLNTVEAQAWDRGFEYAMRRQREGRADDAQDFSMNDYVVAQGAAAKAAGKREEENPYPKNSQPAQRWRDGYRGKLSEPYPEEKGMDDDPPETVNFKSAGAVRKRTPEEEEARKKRFAGKQGEEEGRLKNPNQAHDARPLVFACDGVAGCTAQVIGAFGPVALLEGVGADAGRFFARGRFGARGFASLGEARDLAAYTAQDSLDLNMRGIDSDAAPEFHTGRYEPEVDQRAKLDQLEKKYDLKGLTKPEELAEYRRLRKLVSSDAEEEDEEKLKEGREAYRALQGVKSRNPKVMTQAEKKKDTAGMDLAGPVAALEERLASLKKIAAQAEQIGNAGVAREAKLKMEHLGRELAEEKMKRGGGRSQLGEYRGHDEDEGEDVSATPAQHRAMGAAAGGHSNLGIPQKVGKEFMRADKGKGFSSKAGDAEFSDFEREHPQTSHKTSSGAFRPGAPSAKKPEKDLDRAFEREHPQTAKRTQQGAFRHIDVPGQDAALAIMRTAAQRDAMLRRRVVAGSRV